MQELTRFLAESLGDVITLHQGLQKNLDETELAIHAQARLNRELQQGLMGVRLVPLGNLADRFYRVVRQTAKELEQEGQPRAEGHARRSSTARCWRRSPAPFEHLLRNAIAHGIETPAERAKRGQARDRRDLDRRRAARQRSRAHRRRRRRGAQLPAHPREGDRGGPARARRGAARGAARAVHLHVGLLDRDRGHARSPAAASAWTW